MLKLKKLHNFGKPIWGFVLGDLEFKAYSQDLEKAVKNYGLPKNIKLDSEEVHEMLTTLIEEKEDFKIYEEGYKKPVNLEKILVPEEDPFENEEKILGTLDNTNPCKMSKRKVEIING
jgi:hypothetical protein